MRDESKVSRKLKRRISSSELPEGKVWSCSYILIGTGNISASPNSAVVLIVAHNNIQNNTLAGRFLGLGPRFFGPWSSLSRSLREKTKGQQ